MLSVKSQPSFNAALITPAAEFFAYGDQLDCMHNGQRYCFDSTPVHIKTIIANHLQNNPIAQKALALWSKEEIIDELRQYTFCQLGGYDDNADIDANGNLIGNEYHDCGKRGQCKYEGKICSSLEVANGRLTKTEIEFLKRAHKSNKVIADEMCISEETVNSHVQNTARKTGMTRAELVRFAAKKGIN